MVGQIIGALAQTGASIYGSIKSSEAARQAEKNLGILRDTKKAWYEKDMAEDVTKRSDFQNILRKWKELLGDQYRRAAATNVVAGGTDESLALQKAAANDAIGDTMADMASQASSIKEAKEQQWRAEDAALAQQQIALQQGKAQNIAAAAGQMGSAVSGLMTGAIGEKGSSKSLTPGAVQAYADAQQQMAATLDEDIAKRDEELDKIFA